MFKKYATLLLVSAIAAIPFAMTVSCSNSKKDSNTENTINLGKFNDLSSPLYGTNISWFNKLQKFYEVDYNLDNDFRNSLTKKISEKISNLTETPTEEEALSIAKTKLDKLTNDEIENYINLLFATYSFQMSVKENYESQGFSQFENQLVIRNELSVNNFSFDSNSKTVSFDLTNAIFSINSFLIDGKSQCDFQMFQSIKYRFDNLSLKETAWNIDNKFLPSLSFESNEKSKISITSYTDDKSYDQEAVNSKFKKDLKEMIKNNPEAKIFLDLQQFPDELVIAVIDAYSDELIKLGSAPFVVLKKIIGMKDQIDQTIQNNFDSKLFGSNSGWSGIFNLSFEPAINFVKIGFDYELHDEEFIEVTINKSPTIFKNPILFIKLNNDDVEFDN